VIVVASGIAENDQDSILGDEFFVTVHPGNVVMFLLSLGFGDFLVVYPVPRTLQTLGRDLPLLRVPIF
jgi:hypothetical protein